MEANQNYNDLVGTVVASVSNDLISAGDHDIKTVSKFFNLDENRFKPVGIQLSGTDGFSVSLICVDKQKSNKEKEYIVRMSCDDINEKEIVNNLFERLTIVLYNRFDTKYLNMECDDAISYSDYHRDKQKK